MSYRWQEDFVDKVGEMAEAKGLDSSELLLNDFYPFAHDEGYDWEGVEKKLEEIAGINGEEVDRLYTEEKENEGVSYSDHLEDIKRD